MWWVDVKGRCGRDGVLMEEGWGRAVSLSISMVVLSYFVVSTIFDCAELNS